MKTKLILGGFMTLAAIAYSQPYNTVWPGVNTIANAGLGTAYPFFKMDVVGSQSVDGVRVLADSGGQAALIMLDANAAGGRMYSWGSTSGNDFNMFDHTASSSRMTVKSTGLIGINQTSPVSQLHVTDNGSGTAGYFSSSVYNGVCVGAWGVANGPSWNYAGRFDATGNSVNRGVSAWSTGGSGSFNYGAVLGATGPFATSNIGLMVTANVSSIPANDWGIYCNGRAYCTASAWSSDRKIKDNIRPLENVMNKIMLLKPATYTFKTKEYTTMGLPEGEQTGLIAQELEEIFPSMVVDVKGFIEKNDKGELLVDRPDIKSISYISLIPVLIKGLQEQQKQIGDLQAQLADSQSKTGNATGINQLNSAADGFALDQNIPNPFSQETVINYSLPQQIKNASLIVYDLSGKQLTSFPLELNGKSITINSDKLAAGIYIYSVMADGKIMDSKRMVVADKQ